VNIFLSREETKPHPPEQQVQASGHSAQRAECCVSEGRYSSAKAFSFEEDTTVDAGGNEVKRGLSGPQISGDKWFGREIEFDSEK
jgi:hypothetical protein